MLPHLHRARLGAGLPLPLLLLRLLQPDPPARWPYLPPPPPSLPQVKTKHPFWGRTQGRDHFFWLPNDRGACYLEAGNEDLQKAIKIVHFGLYDKTGGEINPKPTNPDYGCYNPVRDVVAVPYYDQAAAAAEETYGSAASERQKIRLLYIAGGRPGGCGQRGAWRARVGRRPLRCRGGCGAAAEWPFAWCRGRALAVVFVEGRPCPRRGDHSPPGMGMGKGMGQQPRTPFQAQAQAQVRTDPCPACPSPPPLLPFTASSRHEEDHKKLAEDHDILLHEGPLAQSVGGAPAGRAWPAVGRRGPQSAATNSLDWGPHAIPSEAAARHLRSAKVPLGKVAGARQVLNNLQGSCSQRAGRLSPSPGNLQGMRAAASGPA
jgi:hypothetical protein